MFACLRRPTINVSDASDASDAKHHASGARAASRCSCTINPSRYRAVGQWATFSKATHAIDERGPLRSVPSVCSFNFCYTVPRAFGSVQRSTKMNCPAVCRCYYLRERLSTRTSCTPCAKLKERRRKWNRPSESEATALVYANILRALRQVERATAKMDQAE